MDLSAVHGKDTNEAKFDLQLKWGEIFLLVYSITDSKGLKFWKIKLTVDFSLKVEILVTKVIVYSNVLVLEADRSKSKENLKSESKIFSLSRFSTSSPL